MLPAGLPLMIALVLHPPEPPLPPPLPEPALVDLCRFAPHYIAKANSELAEAHWAWLVECNGWLDVSMALGTISPEEAAAWRQQTLDFAFCWWHLRWASDPSTDRAAKLCHLRNLQTHLGRQDWIDGFMPPAVPWWHFRRMD